jgi:hypothetical protein
MSVGNIQITVVAAAAASAAAAVPASHQSAPVVQAKAAAAPAKTSVTTPVNTSDSDAASLSDTAVLLSGLEYQLTTSRPSDFKSLLEGAARSIHIAAQQQESREQSKTLQNIADRLQFAANLVGLSSRSPLSLYAFLE